MSHYLRHCAPASHFAIAVSWGGRLAWLGLQLRELQTGVQISPASIQFRLYGTESRYCKQYLSSFSVGIFIVVVDSGYMPKPLSKRSPKNIIRMRARAEYERSRARSRVTVKNSGTGFYAMHHGVPYQVARTRFSAAELLQNGHPLDMLLRQGAPPRELVKLFPKPQVRAAVEKAIAERMLAGHRTRDIVRMKKGAGLPSRKRSKR